MIRKAVCHGLIGNATYKKDAIAIKAPFAAHEHAQSLKLFLQLLLLPDGLFDTLRARQYGALLEAVVIFVRVVTYQ